MEEAAVKPRDVRPEGARTLPARYYTDPMLLQAELDGLFGTMWFYAGRSEEAQPHVERDLRRDARVAKAAGDVEDDAEDGERDKPEHPATQCLEQQLRM